MHDPTPRSPEPVFSAAWKPRLIVCKYCTDLLVVTGVANVSKHLRRRNLAITGGALAAAAVVVVGTLVGYFQLQNRQDIVHAGLHAKMEFEFLEPIRPGVRVRSRGRVIDKYERRGKPYMVTEFSTADEQGTVLVRGRFTQMLFRD